jgi:hypothetical protein
MPLMELKKFFILKSTFLFNALTDEMVVEKSQSIDISYCVCPPNVGELS